MFLEDVTRMRLIDSRRTYEPLRRCLKSPFTKAISKHLLNDAFNERFDVGVVLSNDTDLVEPIRMVKEELGKPVGIICPCSNAARSLKKVASFVRHISPSRLAASQLANPIPGTTIKKPPSW